MTGTTNVNELLELLNISETILRFNSELESEIVGNGGTILYSYNNIIIASEISEEYFNELSKSSYIDYMQDIPLKKFGEINTTLIDQLDISKIFIKESGSTDYTELSNLDSTDVVYGKTKKSKIMNISGTTTKLSILDSGTAPIITNTIFNLNISINEIFSYYIEADGSLPIKIEIIKPNNYIGDFNLYSNMLTGKTSQSGIYDIEIKAVNKFGYDLKLLTLNVFELVEITNTNLNVYNKIGSLFSYLIESNGDSQKIYSAINLPSGITLNNNIISGVFTTNDTYNMVITVSGETSSDSKILTVNTGYAPVITSLGSIVSQQYSGLTYNITPISSDVIYTVLGILPEGLKFSENIIQGIPIYDGITTVKIKAKNPYGETLKDLRITITSI